MNMKNIKFGKIDLSLRGFGAKRPENLPDTTKALDIIENIVFQKLKEQGFRKHGRTLHRFVSGDISQVINFQSGKPADGMAGIFCVNIGIRVPECDEKQFYPTEPMKKYYKEYECNIRTRLGHIVSGKDVWYDTKKPEKTGNMILSQLLEKVIPVFDILCSREAILKYRRDYSSFDTLNSRLILLEEAMIYGHLGDIEKAKDLYQQYHDNCVKEYENDKKQGRKVWMDKGNRIVFKNQDGNTQDITASKNGYITIFNADHSHIDYIEELGKRLGLFT